VFACHRFLTEKLFNEVIAAAREPLSALYKEVTEWISSKNTKISNICKSLLCTEAAIKMTSIHVLLTIKEFQTAAYESLGIDEADLPYPVSLDKSNYLYGCLSETVHSPDCLILWLQKNEGLDFRKYATFLASRYSVLVDSLDEKQVALGRDTLFKEAQQASSSDTSLRNSGKSALSAIPELQTNRTVGFSSYVQIMNR
jgi:hypothetical protein